MAAATESELWSNRYKEIAREAYALFRNQKRTVPGAKTQMKQLKLNRGFRAEPGRG